MSGGYLKKVFDKASPPGRFRLSLLLLLPVFFLSHCAVVKPYEREKLADPSMEISERGAKQSVMDKLYSTTEGSGGGEEGLSGGCGCSK